MKIAVPKEIEQFEKRVAASPETVKKMVGAGLSVAIQTNAGRDSSMLDSEYQAAGAEIVSDAKTLLKDAALVLKVQKPTLAEIDLLKEGSILITHLQARTNPDLLTYLAKRKITAFSMDLMPRIARAQKMDSLSSQSNLAGYKAVLIAANRLKKIIPMMITAAGTLTPAKVLVLGAGVAGLQAIATARRLGALVEGFDTRPEVKEQVESLGAKFLTPELIQQHVTEADIVITTALIPGKPAPLLITEEAVRGMKEGSVIVDLAAETGGNCVLTEKGVEIVKHGVTLIGTLNIPSLVSTHASQLYSKNIMNFLFEIYKKGQVGFNLEDPVIRETLVTHEGKVVLK